MIEKDLLICDCEYAKYDLKLRKNINKYEKEIEKCREKLNDLWHMVNPFPF